MELVEALPGVRSALMRGDVGLASEEVDRVLGFGHLRRHVIDTVLAPVLRDIGQRWADSEVSLIQEHLATSAVEAVVARMRTRGSAAAPSRASWLVCTLQGEQHRVGAQMAATTLSELGAPVDFVENLTPEAVVDSARARAGVCLACSGPWSIKTSREAALGVAAAGTPVFIGGRGWREWRDHRSSPGITYIDSMDELAAHAAA